MSDKKVKEKDIFVTELLEKWQKWLGAEDPELREAIDDFSGGLFVEMRKMTAIICKLLEDNKIDDGVKQEIKDEINRCWYNINSHQKIGNEKLCIFLSKNDRPK